MKFTPWRKKFCWLPKFLHNTKTGRRKIFWLCYIEEREGHPDTLSGCFEPDDYKEYRA